MTGAIRPATTTDTSSRKKGLTVASSKLAFENLLSSIIPGPRADSGELTQGAQHWRVGPVPTSRVKVASGTAQAGLCDRPGDGAPVAPRFRAAIVDARLPTLEPPSLQNTGLGTARVARDR